MIKSILIKGLKYILIIIALLFGLFYLLPGALLSLPSIQQKISKAASEELSNLLAVPVSVKNVSVEWLNRIVLEDVYVEDQSAYPLLEASYLSADFDLLPLFKKKLVFNTVRLFGLNVKLRKETPESPLNLQFIIDALAGDSTKEESNIDLRINSILLRRSTFQYDLVSAEEVSGRFDKNHILVTNLNAKIAMKAFNKDSVNAQINRLSFEEKSGLSVQKISMGYTANDEKAVMKDLKIIMPNTTFHMPNVSIDYGAIDSVSQLYSKAPISMIVAPSKIGADDFAAFVPALKNIKDPFEFSANVEGVIDNIKLTEASLEHESGLLFSGNMYLRNLFSERDLYLEGKVNRLTVAKQAFITALNTFNVDQTNLPIELGQLGTVSFTGEVSGFPDNLVAYGNLATNVGDVRMDILFGKKEGPRDENYISGRILTSELDLGALFKGENPYGLAQFDLDIDTRKPRGGHFYGKVNANINRFDFKGYQYSDLLIKGSFSKDVFDGLVHIVDPNIHLYAEGVFNNTTGEQFFDFQASVEHFKPDSLNLSTGYEEPEFSFVINSNLTNTSRDDIQGYITINDLEFRSKPGNFHIEKIALEAVGDATDRRLTLTSDLFEGELKGRYSFQTLVNNLKKTLYTYFPALHDGKKAMPVSDQTQFELMLTVHNMDSVSRLLKLPFSILHDSRIMAFYNASYGKFRAEAYMPLFKVGGREFEGGYLKLENPKDKAELTFKSVMKGKNDVKNFLELRSDASVNMLNSSFKWENNSKDLYRADLNFSTLFSRMRCAEEPEGNGLLNTTFMLREGGAIIKDSLWRLSPSTITLQGGEVTVEGFNLSKNDQHLMISGHVSKDPERMLYVDLKDIELSYIFDILNKPSLSFGGKATGTVNANDLFVTRILTTDLQVEDFSFNRVTVGDLDLYSFWDEAAQGILMRGKIATTDTTKTTVDGYLYPVGEKAGLTLRFDAENIDIGFIQPYMEKVAKGLKGRGYGQVHVFGPFKGVTVEGNAYVKDAGLGIDFLNTYYTFSDSLFMTPTSISARNLTVYDEEGNSGTVNLEVTHETFDHIAYKVDLTADNLLAYNVPTSTNPTLSGRVYASGNGSLDGNENRLDIEVNAMSMPNSVMRLDFMSDNISEEYDFVKFITKDSLASLAGGQPTTDTYRLMRMEDTGLDIHMNFNLNITPDAKIELVMDRMAGDMIRGSGMGNIEINYGTRTDLAMYGTCTITDGKYNFSLQQIIKKDFQIAEGSSVTFTGNPFDALLDIQGIYSLSANINDLDENLSQEMARTNIPVHCLLNVSGKLHSPALSFDITLPTVNQDIEQRVKSYIDTEDTMLRQFVYLLVLNKFYTADYLNNDYNSGMSAFASSALSYQLSNILSSITDKVQIGTNILSNQARGSETEVEMLLSSHLLDNRLTINGNFGYRDNNIQRTFIGEFDLEYKLTKDGGIRLKAYNHSNDMYRYYKKSLYRQGVGVMFRRDFSGFYDLFGIKRRKPLYIPIDTTPQDSILASPEVTQE